MNGNSSYGSSFFGYGVSQNSRPNKALDPDYAKLDSRKTSDLLAYASELSKYINYYNFDNKVDGTWEPFFLSDISVIISLIISTDIRDIEEQANHFIQEFYQTESLDVKVNNYTALRQLIVDIISKFDFWYKHTLRLNLKERRFESSIESELYNICIQRIKPILLDFYSHVKASEKISFFTIKHDVEVDHLHEIWALDEVEELDVFFGNRNIEKITAGMLTLRLHFKQIFSTLSFSIQHFEKYFESSLALKSDHNPDMALFISFLKIFQYVQKDFNRISERLLYFYYKRILKIDLLNGEPDYVHVHFELSESNERFFLKEGTMLLADTDEDGRDVIFETVDPIEITSAKIEKLQTVFCSRLDDMGTSNYKLTSHIYAAPVANSRDGLGQRFENKYDTWPIFGEEQEYKPQDDLNMVDAKIGWAFSSPVLHLAEGNRTITIRLDFIPESTRIFKRLVYDVYNKVNDERAPGEPKKIIQEVFYERIFNQLDKSRNFFIYLSGAREWIEVDPNTIAVKAVGDGDWVYDSEVPPETNIQAINALEISFKLPVSAPAITNYNPEQLDGHTFDTLDPVIQFVLNDKKQPYIFSFLQAVELQTVQIHVKVDKCKNINVEDPSGVWYNNKSIYPFSQIPKRGMQCRIVAPELFKKHLTKVDINIQWDNIPETVKDFVANYANYKDPLHPADLKVQIGALSNYEIEMDYDDALLFPLFTTTEGDPKIHEMTELDKSHFSLTREAINMLQIVPNYDLENTLFSTVDLDTGYFVIELIEPRNALYANIYQNEVQEALNKNIEDPTSQKKFPSEPVLPFIKNVTLSYEAEATFNVAFGDMYKAEKIFHIHPFGLETVYENSSPIRSYMLPKYTDDGYLFIGLKDVNAPETFTMYFQLSSEDTKEQTIKTVPKIEWFYLTENRFVPFEDSKIIFDTTYGFTESGIIKLRLPFAINGSNTIIDEDLSWIVVKVNGDVDKLCKAMYVAPNAVLAKWQFDEEQNERLLTRIQEEEIKDFYVSHPEIREIYQPFESFGGRTPETIKEYNCRVSENIRHKYRAVTHWDIERIILDQFPNVLQVKTISHLSDPLDKEGYKKQAYVFADEGENVEYNGLKHADGVKVVVVPTQDEFKRVKTPKLSLHRLLQIQQYVSTLTTTFMNIEIKNPQYEYVRVVANVKFIENYNNGLTLNRLFEDINRYIAPWLTDDTADVKIGGSINENVIQNYIKGLPYVKFLTKFSILHIIEEDGLFKIQDTAMEQDIVSIIKAKPWGVLLPDDHHEIEMINYEEEEEPISRVNSDEIIRFQNKVNILGDKKYIKIKNPKSDVDKNKNADDQTLTTITINI